MDASRTNYISNCASLPNILSYVHYRKVERCLTLNRRFYEVIKRDWRMMKKPPISVMLHGVRGRDAIQLKLIGFRIHCDVTITDRLYDISHPHGVPLLPPSLRYALGEKASKAEHKHFINMRQPNKQTTKMEGISLILEMLLPRVRIRNFTMDAMQFDGGTFHPIHLTTILNELKKYTAQLPKGLADIRSYSFDPIYNDIVRCLGADCKLMLHQSFFARPEHKPCSNTLRDLNTSDCAVRLFIYRWSPQELIELAEEWQRGERRIKILEINIITILTLYPWQSQERIDYQQQWIEVCSHFNIDNFEPEIEIRGNINEKVLKMKFDNYKKVVQLIEI